MSTTAAAPVASGGPGQPRCRSVSRRRSVRSPVRRLSDVERAGRALAVVALLVSLWSAVTPAVVHEHGPWDDILVDHGQSLWEIAAANPVPGADVAHTVAAIRARNGLDSAVLQPGQRLSVPGRVSRETAVALR